MANKIKEKGREYNMATKQFVNLLDAPYSRRGSFIAFANDNFGEDEYGRSHLWLCNCRTVGFAMANLDHDSGYRQIKLEAVRNGVAVPCTLKTTAEEVILVTRHGEFRFCIGERNMVMGVGKDGLTLRITPRAKFLSPGVINMMDAENRQLIDFNLSRMLVTPLVGTLTKGAGFMGPYVEITPDENGELKVALEDFLIDPVKRAVAEYPTYEECVESVRADFAEFCEKVMPELPGEFEEARLQALWQTWNLTVLPDGQSDYKRTMIKMIHCIFESAFVWQQPMQAVWLSRCPELSWEVFRSSFDFMDANGRLVDGVAFKAMPGGDGLKPPINGYMLSWLIDNGKIDHAPVEEKKWLLERLIKWTEYFVKFRDKDGDGLCEFQTALETGWEDASYYNTVGFPCASPDLNSYLALQMEAVAKLGALCGMPQEEIDSYNSRAAALVEKIVEKFWDGEKWIAFNPETGAKSDTLNISLYTALLLGDRLPKEIVEKSIETMFGPDGFDTPYGLATEGLTSDRFAHGFTQGSIITPAEFIMCLALENCGRFDLAKKVGVNYCKIMKDNGFFHIHDALTGKGDRSLTAFGERGLFWSAWTSSCYFFMADRYGRD